MDKTNILCLLATRGMDVPVMVAEHTDPNLYPIGQIWSGLRRWTYRWADRIMVLNKQATDYFPSALRRRTHVMPNPVTVNPGDASGEDKADRRIVISVGRFTEEKGFDVLLTAFAKAVNDFPDWDLVIAGDGPLRGRLEALRDKLGVGRRVRFVGVVDDPHRLMRQADLYVSASRIEGFPMALCEAMACGLPLISTYYHSGVEDIIEDEVNGLLVPVDDAERLAQAMVRLMGDEEARGRLAVEAVGVGERFGVEKVMQRWNTLLDEVSSQRATAC
jgi:glycosyltransferase involved in cell wall biosynthesis